MYKHMINWEMVIEDMAGLTPKGNESVHIHIGLPIDTMLVITGDRTKETLYLPAYPERLIPVYGF